MGVPTGRLQFFALEASDYLERLAVIVGRSVPPDPDELIRLTRALRGAALMAGLGPFAQAAGAFEQLAKAHRQEPSSWTPARAELAASAIEELKRLTRQAPDWSDRDAEAARRLAREIGIALGQLPIDRPRVVAESDELKPSVRAFIGREGALIAGTLEHAAPALELGQPAATTDLVLARLQPLRGLASLPRLSPLPEFLDAIELTIRSLRDEAAPPDAPLALRRAAGAVTRLARDIAGRGEAGPDAPEVVLGAVSLLESFGLTDDVVPIQALFAADDRQPIVRQGLPSQRSHGPEPAIELVSLADRFRQAAEQLAAPMGAVGRTLYLYGLLVQLRPLTQAAPRERPYLAPLLEGIAEAIGRGRAGRAPRDFAAALRETADRIGEAAEARNAVFLGDELTVAVDMVARVDAPAAVPSPEPRTEPAPEPEPVPIESLAPEPEPVAPLNAFERSFSTLHRLASEPAPAPPPLEAAADVVPIASLLYRGRRALERADVVRLELSRALRRQQSFAQVEPLVSELIDLVPLALEE